MSSIKNINQQTETRDDFQTNEEKYWLENLSGSLKKAIISYDFLKKTQEKEEKCCSYHFSDQISQRLIEFSNNSDIRLHMILMAVLNVLIQKYTSLDDILIGTPVLKQESEEEFINTVLVIRSKLNGDELFKDLLLDIRDSYVKAIENQNYPIQALVHKLHIDIDDDQLFDIAIILENIQDIKYLEQSNHNLTFSFAKNETNISCNILYNSDLYKEETIKKILSRCEYIIEQCCFNVEKALCDVEIITEKEKEQIYNQFNDTSRKYNKQVLIHQLFEDKTALFPTKTAVMYDGIGASYKEINQKANQLAGYLNSIGISGETIVGILLEPSIDLVVSILATLKAGAAYLPLDISNPINRIKNIIADSGADYVISGAGVSNNLEVKNNIDLKSLDLTKFGTENKPICYSEDKLLYVIYTSGSMGKPKGVKVSHTGFLNLLQAHVDIFGNSEEDNMTLVASSGFDAMAFELWPSLTCGATLYIANPEIQVDPLKMKGWLLDNKITITYQPTFIGECLIEEQWDPENTDLKFLRVAGDRLKQYPSKELPFKLFNLYGPTEDTVWTTFAEISPNSDKRKLPVIGKPINNKQIYILGKDNNLQPIGIPGEICITGDGLAIGYLNNKEQDLEKFVQDTFLKGNRMYKTGDVGKWLPDGDIEFIGRIDEQVKLRGYRIELGEIEMCLLQHKNIKQAVVNVFDDGSEDIKICGYYVAEETILPSDIRNFLVESLPIYMIPGYLQQIDQIPLLSNGKIDKKSLPIPQIDTSDIYEAPKSYIEKKLVDVFEEVLNLKKVGINDNFFSLGGDSIKAIQIAALLLKSGLKVEIRDLFINPTIKILKNFVIKVNSDISQEMVEGEIELATVHKRLIKEYGIKVNQLNQSVMLFFKEGIDETTLTEVFTEIVKHHDALRIRYRSEDNTNMLYNNSVNEKLFDIEVFNVDDKNTIEKEIQTVKNNINIETSSPVKLGLFKATEGDRLLIVIHQFVIDAVSWKIILGDLATGLQLAKNNEEISFKNKTHSYKYWCEKIKEFSASTEILKEANYWNDIESKPIKEITSIIADNKQMKVEKNVNSSIKLDKLNTEKMFEKANWAYNTKTADILISALGLTIKDVFDINQTIIMLEGTSREVELKGVNIERTVGNYSFQYPVYIEYPKSDDLSNLIKTVKETLRNVPNKGIGYELNTDNHSNKNSLINFDYLENEEIASENNDYEISSIDFHNTIESKENSHVLNVFVIIQKDKVSLNVNYNRDGFEPEAINMFLKLFKDNLNSTIEHCAQKENQELTSSDTGNAEISNEDMEQIGNLINNID